ncbi:Rieske (2Fe-2S) protein [Falsiroseomonas oryzae]|uniref:Rieske (2Fe-2S) protein n=1 Tax=Falsiroseomonas oryzae TaxID=2766473 RepID=UPI0022EAAA77|nr:Rieske (2Fe-2S) protein [Roseomonas sp. MO-31]
MSRHIVATVDEIAPGSSKLVTVKGREIAVFNVKGEFFALFNRCPHEGAPLCKGQVVSLVESDEPGTYRMSRQGELLRCPWHGWEFDIRTGQSYCDPANTWVRKFAVAVEPGERLAKGPYVAETFPVSVEQDYLVIEM